LAFKCVFHLNI